MTSVADLMLRLAKYILPAHRADWDAAMRAELAHIGQRDALAFATGCLFAGLHERTTHTFHNGTAAAKLVCLAACTLLALLGLANAVQRSEQGTALGIVFTLSGAIWGAAFAATALKSWKKLVLVASSGLGVSVAQAIGMILSLPVMQPHSPLIWTLSEEGFVLFGALLAAAQVFRRGPQELR